MILSLYARGLSTRDIEAHLLEVYGVTASRELISNVTEVPGFRSCWRFWGMITGVDAGRGVAC